MTATNIAPEKSFVFDFVDRNEKAVATIGDSVFYFGELGMQEVESAKLMTGLLEEAGFAVERGISGFPTGFCATFGSGEPVIALHTEYDANPNNSQVSGATEQKNITTYGPGHCEGHNCNAAVMVSRSGFTLLKKTIREESLHESREGGVGSHRPTSFERSSTSTSNVASVTSLARLIGSLRLFGPHCRQVAWQRAARNVQPRGTS